MCRKKHLTSESKEFRLNSTSLIEVKERRMKDLIDRVIELNAPADPKQAEALIKACSNTSLSTLKAVTDYFKAEEKQILSKDLLEWMQENDQVLFETEEVKVSIKTFVSAKMEDTETGFKWLIENQYGDLIKDNLEFPKGELTPEAEGILDELGLSYTKKSGIHPQSLKKIISDRLKDGEDLPEEDNGIKIGYYDECSVKEK